MKIPIHHNFLFLQNVNNNANSVKEKEIFQKLKFLASKLSAELSSIILIN
jgi:hypothetical protein